MRDSRIAFAISFSIAVFFAIGIIVLATIPAKKTIDTTSDSIGPANLIWRIHFADDSSDDFEDFLTGTPLQDREDDALSPFSASQFTKSSLEKWKYGNDYNNALCQRAVDGKIAAILQCQDPKKCTVKISTLADMWGDEAVHTACTTSTVREKSPSVSLETLCYAQVQYLLNVKQVTGESIIHDSQLPHLILESFPISVFYTKKAANIDLLDIVTSNDTIDSRTEKICKSLQTGDVLFVDKHGNKIALQANLEGTPDYSIVSFLQDNLNQPEHLATVSSPPHKADLVVIIGNQSIRERVVKWADSQFDWTKEKSPKKDFRDANDTVSVVKAFENVYSSSEFSQEHIPKTMFIVESVENLDTVRKFMTKYLYMADLSADHWIYFYSSPYDQKSDNRTTNYLANNAWEDVHWIENLDQTNKTSDDQMGYVPRFYGLRRRSPTMTSWVIHVKKPSLKMSDIPEQFDYRNHAKSRCLYQVASQGFCGSCWAVTASEMISSVKCLASDAEIAYPVSTQDILSCVESDIYGCRGAYMSDALLTARNAGFVNESCVPYYNGNCGDLHNHGMECSAEAKQGIRLVPTATCKLTCENGVQKNRRKVVKDVYWLNVGTNGRTAPAATSVLIQEYIMTRGPVIAGISIYPDFETYDAEKDIYIHKHDPRQRMLGGHAILLVGWGTETLPNGVKADYWIAKNSWGPEWGDKGYFRLMRGQGGGRCFSPFICEIFLDSNREFFFTVPYVEDEVYSIELEKTQLHW